MVPATRTFIDRHLHKASEWPLAPCTFDVGLDIFKGGGFVVSYTCLQVKLFTRQPPFWPVDTAVLEVPCVYFSAVAPRSSDRERALFGVEWDWSFQKYG